MLVWLCAEDPGIGISENSTCIQADLGIKRLVSTMSIQSQRACLFSWKVLNKQSWREEGEWEGMVHRASYVSHCHYAVLILLHDCGVICSLLNAESV